MGYAVGLKLLKGDGFMAHPDIFIPLTVSFLFLAIVSFAINNEKIGPLMTFSGLIGFLTFVILLFPS